VKNGTYKTVNLTEEELEGIDWEANRRAHIEALANQRDMTKAQEDFERRIMHGYPFPSRLK
jgi:hypothetical protein